MKVPIAAFACLLGASVAVVLAQPPAATSDSSTGVKTRAELDALVARLRSGELKGPQALFDRPNATYRVYTSFIDKRKGAADIHHLDDEVYVVLSGSARATLGGQIVDGKGAAVNETRGTQIVGGTTQAVGVGDIVSAPRGTPHQFDAGDGYILYVVIKVMGSAAS